MMQGSPPAIMSPTSLRTPAQSDWRTQHRFIPLPEEPYSTYIYDSAMSETNIIVDFVAPNGDYLGKLQEWIDKNHTSLNWSIQNIGTQGRPVFQATPTSEWGRTFGRYITRRWCAPQLERRRSQTALQPALASKMLAEPRQRNCQKNITRCVCLSI